MSYSNATAEKTEDRNNNTCWHYWQAARGFLVISRIAAVLIGFVCLLGSAARAGVSQDGNGWTVFTPSPVTSGTCASRTANGTCVIYVNTPADGGNDSTCAPARVGDTSHPCATIAKGISLLRTGYPDWLLLKKGDSWVGGYFLNVSGKSSSEPMVISAYDPANPSVANPYTGGARPLLIVPTGGGNGIQIQANIGGDNLAFVGLEFYASDRDPNNSAISPIFNASTVDSGLTGLLTVNRFSWFLLEDCKFSFFNGDILVTPNSAVAPAGTLILRRNLVLDAYGIMNGTYAMSGGIMIGRITTPIFEENIFDHNGFNETLSNSCCTVLTHNIYIEGYNPVGGTSDPATLSIITFQGNIVARDGGSGSQFRSGGTIDNNLWLLNPLPHNIGAPTAAGPNLVTNNVYLEGLTNSAVRIGGGPQTLGTNLGNGDNYAVGVPTFSGNIIANAHAIGGGIAVGGGFLRTVIQNNIIFNWGPAGQEIQNYSGGSIVDTANTKDAIGSNSGGLNEPFPNPYQLNAVGNSSNTGTNGVDGYYAHIGNPGGFPSTSVGFLSAVRRQSKANWNPALMAAAVNTYVRAGFGLTSSTTTAKTTITSTGSPTTTATPASVSANAPSVTVNSPVNGATFNGQSDVNIAVSAAGGSIASLAVTVDGNTLKTCLSESSCSATWPWRKISKGTHTVGGHASDTTGHASSASVTIANF